MKTHLLLSVLLCGSLTALGAVSDLDKKYNVKRGNAKTQQTGKSKTTSNSRGRTKPQPKPAPEQASQSSTLLAGLYDGEEIRMPDALLKEVQDINGKLKEVLSEQDYLAILKGELAWYVSKKAQGKKMAYSELKGLLNAILKDPANDRLFRWPRFHSASGEGVHFVKTIGEQQNAGEYNANFIGYSDDRFCFWQTSENRMSVFDVRTGILSGTISLPCFPLTTILTRIPGSDMYFLSIAQYMNVGMYTGVSQTAEAGTWQESGCGFASIVDAEGRRMQTFLFGRYSPGDCYDPRKSALFARSGFPLERYMALKPSRRDFTDSVASAYAFTRSHDEYGVSRPSWGDWERWMTPGKTRDEWEPDDLYADKNKRESWLTYLKEDMIPKSQKQRLNFRTLKMEAPKQAAGGDIKDLPTYVLDKLGGKITFTDGWERVIEWADVEAVQSGSYIAFTFTSDPFELIKSVFETYQLADFITPDGRILVYDNKNTGKKFKPYDRSACCGDELDVDSPTAEVLKKPISLSISQDGKATIMWKETPSDVGGEDDARVLIQEVDLNSCKVVSESTFDRVLENYDAESGFIVTKVDENHFRLNKLTDKEVDDTGVDYYISGNHYALVLPDGKYCGTPGCESMLKYNHNGVSMGMSALAPWRNRPAAVLRALGGLEEDAAVLEETTNRWLARKGISPDAKEPALEDFPQAQVELPPLESKSPTCTFRVRLNATVKDIVKLHVTVDGIDIGCVVEDLPIAAGESKDITLSVPLIAGQNWICVTPEDADGNKGGTTRFRTVYNAADAKQGTLYVVALGVSDYDDASMALQYAAKDAADVADTFSKVCGEDCKTLLLVDKEVDGNVLSKVGAFLSAARPEDAVIVYIAGHGLLDDKLEYYYAPCTFDGDDVEGSGISMQQITDAISVTPARKRLLLLDTCHSGVLGEEGEEKMTIAMGGLPAGVRAVQTRGMKVKKVECVLNANQKKRYIEEMFNMTESIPGINVISGAAGAEFAMESGEWNNGVFTAALLEAITNSADADANGDGIICLPELANYVQLRVLTLTNGSQQPCDNLMQESPYFTVSKGLRAFVPQDEILPNLTEKVRPASGNWEPLVNALRRCRKTEQDFKKIYPDVFDGGVMRNAPPSLLEEIERLTGGKTTADYGAHLVQACEKFNPTEILQLLDKGADVNAVDYKGDTPLLIVIKHTESAILENKQDVDVFNDVLGRLKKAGADPFRENENGECAADHTDERLNLAVKHAIRHIQTCNTDTPNQQETEL